MRYTTLKARAERYAQAELGWEDADAVDATSAGSDGGAVAVLIDPVRSTPFVIVYDEWDALATDAGNPSDFGW